MISTGKNKARIDPATRQQVVKLLSQGLKKSVVSARTGVSKTTVTRIDAERKRQQQQ